jgi:hypothetical protein
MGKSMRYVSPGAAMRFSLKIEPIHFIRRAGARRNPVAAAIPVNPRPMSSRLAGSGTAVDTVASNVPVAANEVMMSGPALVAKLALLTTPPAVPVKGPIDVVKA